jgi:hypothetical protein
MHVVVTGTQMVRERVKAIGMIDPWRLYVRDRNKHSIYVTATNDRTDSRRWRAAQRRRVHYFVRALIHFAESTAPMVREALAASTLR